MHNRLCERPLPVVCQQTDDLALRVHTQHIVAVPEEDRRRNV